MKADWFTIIKKYACNKQKNENEGEKCYHAFAAAILSGAIENAIDL